MLAEEIENTLNEIGLTVDEESAGMSLDKAIKHGKEKRKQKLKDELRDEECEAGTDA